MSNHRLSCIALPSIAALALATCLVGCTDDPDATTPDGMPAPRPLDPTGTFAVRSVFSLTAPPSSATAVLVELAGATDGPDDPSRFLVDRLVARLPEGQAQVVAAAVAPYVAAYVQQRIDSFAPELAPGLRALADGVHRLARRFGTTGTLHVEAQMGIDTPPALHATHTFTGFVADDVVVAFAPLGMADLSAHTTAALVPASTTEPAPPMSPPRDPSGVPEGAERVERLAIGEHAVAFPYGALLRLGVDRAVVPQTVPGARDLADAFDRLVDCDRLGEHVAAYLGIGSPELYATACSVALVRLAAEIYSRLDLPDVELSIAGHARAVDVDRDASVDALDAGVWTGRLGEAPLAASSFDGAGR